MGTWELGNFGILELWNFGTLELWNFGTLELWNLGARELGSLGTWELRNLEILELGNLLYIFGTMSPVIPTSSNFLKFIGLMVDWFCTAFISELVKSS